MDDLPREFVIRESSHRIHSPFTSEKLATQGRALYLSPGTSVLDLACGVRRDAVHLGARPSADWHRG